MTGLVCFLQIAVWGMQAGVQLLLIQCFNSAINFHFSDFLFWTSYSLMAWGFYFGIGFLQTYAQSFTIQRLNNQLRHDLLETLLLKTHQEYHQQDTGEYISWLTNNIKQVEKLAWHPFFDAVGRVAQVLWSMVILFTLHWSLMVASLVFAMIILILPKCFKNKMEKMGENCSHTEALSLRQLKDLLSGFEVFSFFGKGQSFIQKGDRISNQIEKTFFKFHYTKDAIDCLIGFISVSIQILSNILIVLLTFQGVLIPAVLAGGSNLIAGVTNGLNQFSSLHLSISASQSYFQEIIRNPKPAKITKQKPMPPCARSIKVENLSFQYHQTPVLTELNLEFKIGKKYALVGPSGCGKSTLLKILLGWLPEYTGKILLDGQEAGYYTIEERQKQMAYIPQNIFLFHTTIGENITLGGNFTQQEMEEALSCSALTQDLATMPDGLETMVGEGGRNLSGGQKQRIAIARALIHHRSILLIDEGTSSLDHMNADIVERSLLSNSNLTLILVSHHLTEKRKEQFDKIYTLTPQTERLSYHQPSSENQHP